MNSGWAMTSIGWCGFVMRWFIALSLPFLLLLAGARLLLSYEFLRFEYMRPGFPADPYGFTVEDRLDYGMEAIDFLFSAEGVETLAQLRLPWEKCWQPPTDAESCPLFNARELVHLEDVKRLLAAGFSLALVGLAAATFCLSAANLRQMPVICRRAILDGISAGLKQGAALTLAIILALAVSVAAAWDRAFDAFHELLFSAGTWRFPFSDSLIRLYPEQLFVDAALVMGGLAAAAALLILAALRLLERSQS